MFYDYIHALLPRDELVTDDRPKPEVPAFMDDPRPSLIMENVTGVNRHRGTPRRGIKGHIKAVADKIVMAARSIS